MCKELSEELARGEKSASDLAEHLRIMGAANTKFRYGGIVVSVYIDGYSDEQIKMQKVIDMAPKEMPDGYGKASFDGWNGYTPEDIEEEVTSEILWNVKEILSV